MHEVLAVDLGGTQLRAARVDAASGEILELRRERSPRDGPEAVVARIARLVEQLGIGLEADRPIGLASPGPLDPRSGTTFALPNLPGFEGYPLADAVAERTGRACRIHNDASLAALGEAWLGAGRGADPLLYVTWSTGIGGGIVSAGEIFGGALGLAGEIGHLVVRQGGPACALGHAGCAEGIGSGSGILARARREQRADVTDAAAVFRSARAGDRASQGLIDDAACAFGLALAGGINLIDPERVVIGGGLAIHAWDRLIPGVVAELEAHVLAWDRRRIEIRPAALGDAAGLLGAARYVAGGELARGRSGAP